MCSRESSLYYFIFLNVLHCPTFIFFFFNDTATTEIYTLSLHDALPILTVETNVALSPAHLFRLVNPLARTGALRSEEHTSELQSQSNLVCRLLLEKKKKQIVFPDFMIVMYKICDRIGRMH